MTERTYSPTGNHAITLKYDTKSGEDSWQLSLALRAMTIF